MADGKVQIWAGKVLTESSASVDGVATDDDCCCEAECNCICENCKELSASLNAPCCWAVQILGIVEGECGACSKLNRQYYLPQDADNNCRWSNRCIGSNCDPDEISLEVTKETGPYGAETYAITVTLGGHVWSKTYADDPPDCCIKHTLNHATSSGDCDSSNSTCVITVSEANCPTDCCDDYCKDMEAPDALAISITGWATGALCHVDQCECMARTTYLTGSDCAWTGGGQTCWMCGQSTVFTATLSKSGDDYLLTVTGGTQQTWQKNFGTTKPDCMAFNESLPLLSQPEDAACDGTNTTCTVVAAHGATRTTYTNDSDDFCDNCGASVPDQFKLEISGVANRSPAACDDCPNLNGIYYLERCDCEQAGGCGIQGAGPSSYYLDTGGNICIGGGCLSYGFLLEFGRSGNSGRIKLSMFGTYDGFVWTRSDLAFPLPCGSLDIQLENYFTGTCGWACDLSGMKVRLTAA